MKSWVRLTALALALLTPPAIASARPDHGWGGQQERAQQERAQPQHERPEYAPPPERGGGRGGERGYYEQGYGRPKPEAYPPARQPGYPPPGAYAPYGGYRQPAYPPEAYGRQAYRPEPYAPPAAYGRLRRGQVLPPSARGEAIGDYGRYHLRRPPRGYYWVRQGGDFVLLGGSGMVFDVVPGGY